MDLSGSDDSGIHLLRTLTGGHFNQYIQSDGHTTVATIRDTNPWIHFDVPDGFLFYNVERVPVEVTVQVYGGSSSEQVGFNFYYDAVGGMRTSPWQWIDVGSRDIFTYKVRMNDAIFAGREGYDLRLNMGGSADGVRLVNITMRKLLPGSANSDGRR